VTPHEHVEAWERSKDQKRRRLFSFQKGRTDGSDSRTQSEEGPECEEGQGPEGEAGHDTLGKLAKLMNDHGQWWNREVKGIGEQSADAIQEAFVKFWQDHPEYCAS
jgi:hypothetical protein